MRRNRGEDDEWEDEFEEEHHEHVPEVDGPSFAPVFTGLLNSNGNPVFRHPVSVRFGFHPPERAFYAPTLEESEFMGGDSVLGWSYDNI